MTAFAEGVDIRHQQVRAPIKQVYGKEEGPAWNPMAAIIRHLRGMHVRGERRNALRCAALRLLKVLEVRSVLRHIGKGSASGIVGLVRVTQTAGL
jgi:hypothetical protein